MEHNPQQRLKSPVNMSWAPRPGWATVRLVGTCADRTLRRGQIVYHNPSEDYDVPGQSDGLPSGAMVIVLAEAARLVEDDFHLVPEIAIVAVGESLP
jgi:hypothetical protein